MKSGAVVAIALLAAGAAGIALVQPSLAATSHAVKMREDVYVLPPPEELRVATLGYKSAAADVLWSNLLVQYGIHVAEKRPFPDLPKYLDAVLALEPDYRAVFEYCDTLIVFRPPVGTADDARLARSYLERGVAARPYDWRVWLHYGQFVAFLGPSFLTAHDEKERWRKEGSEAILRAVELGADADSAISAATILSKTNERDASIAQLQRAYALTDDPQTRQEIAAKLDVLKAGAQRETIEKNLHFIEDRWRSQYTFLSRDAYLIVGPPVDPLACAGPDAPRATCANDWEERLPAPPRPGALY